MGRGHNNCLELTLIYILRINVGNSKLLTHTNFLVGKRRGQQ